MKELFILRGVPGAGKTTVANLFGGVDTIQICADDCWEYDYTTDPRGYTPAGAAAAHGRCRMAVADAMERDQQLLIVEWCMEDRT